METRSDKQTKSEPDRGSDRPNIQLYRISSLIFCCSFWLNLRLVATAIRF